MCEYCENGKNLFLTRESFRVLNNDTSTMVITNLKKGIVEIASQDSFSIYDKPTRTIRRIEINFCPICGRYLVEEKSMVKMVMFDDETYVPEECCTITNPMTSGGKSEIDDVEMPCEGNCDGECSKCVVQKIMNEYAVLTGQAEKKDSHDENGFSDYWEEN